MTRSFFYCPNKSASHEQSNKLPFLPKQKKQTNEITFRNRNLTKHHKQEGHARYKSLLWLYFPTPTKNMKSMRNGKKKVMHQQPFPSAAMYLPVLLPEQAKQSFQQSAHCLPSLLSLLHNRSLHLGREIFRAAVTPFRSLQ